MRPFILASLLSFSFTHLYAIYPVSNDEPLPQEEEKKLPQDEIAETENAYEYNLYDRQQDKRNQQQRQQYFYYQNQNQNQGQSQNQNAPQYTRKKQPLHSQYFDSRNE